MFLPPYPSLPQHALRFGYYGFCALVFMFLVVPIVAVVLVLRGRPLWVRVRWPGSIALCGVLPIVALLTIFVAVLSGTQYGLMARQRGAVG